ncbi:hypothetical protein [Streptomyces akebiae]|nr:hypothetical protein [Streptomyces akebiae]
MSWSIEFARTIVAVASEAFWAHRNWTLPAVDEVTTVAQIWKAT